MLGHNVTLIAVVGFVAAIDGGTEAACNGVQIAIAVICALHAITVSATRAFRAPIANPLQSLQSILFGLMSCSELINHPTSQSIFVTAMLVTSCLTTAAVVVVVVMELRLQQGQVADDDEGGRVADAVI